MRRLTIALTLVLGFAGCGGENGGPSPSPSPSPSPTPTPSNRSPVISNVTVTPAWGVSELTTFSYSASASDPDNDSLSYQWDITGVSSRTGASGSLTYNGAGTGTFKVTVSDGKGGTASDSRNVTVGSMSGNWIGYGASLGVFTMQLTQKGPIVTGTYLDAEGSASTPSDLPGSINGAGVLVLRIKQAPFRDWTFNGQMDQGGRRITGTMQGSGFNGQAFYMDKQ